MTSGRWAAGLLLISAALLAYELLLMRLLALAYWGHFAGLVISIAMLGIASSGLFLFFRREQVKARPRRYVVVTAGLFGIAAPLAFLCSQRLPFTPFLLTWSAHEYALLAARSLLFFVPFFFAGVAVGTPFLARVMPMGRLYFWNMLGSGLPALPLLWAMNHMHPMRCLVGVTALALAVPMLWGRDAAPRRPKRVAGPDKVPSSPDMARASDAAVRRPYRFAARVIWSTAALLVVTAVVLSPFRYSEYKDLPKTFLLPEAKLLEERYGWDGVVQIVDSPHTRYLPGLSLNFAGTLPQSRLVFTDAGAMTLAFTPADALANSDFLRMTPEAFSFALTSSPSLLHLYGSTADLWRAQVFGARHVRVLDDCATRIAAVEAIAGTRFIWGDARQRLESESAAFDVLTVSLLGTHGTSTAGAASLDPSFLLTSEGVSRLFSRLNPGGHALFSTWVENPPRSGVRLAALLIEALRQRGITRPGAHLMAIRSWSTVAVFVSGAPFAPEAIAALKNLCEENSFDLVWYDGIHPAETNRINVLPVEPYHEAFAALLGPNAQEFIATSPFALTSPTDDRPFFNQYFRWAAVPQWISTMGMTWLPFVEWGYILHVAALVVVALLGVLLLLVPCLFTRAGPTLRSGALFFSLGVGYMFVQIWAIYKLSQFVAHPLLASALVLSVMLAASGAGATIIGRGTRARFASLLGALLISIFVFPLLLRCFYGQAIGLRALLGALWVVLPAFFMGFPFPSALASLTRSAEIPWALALNGFGSVIGSLLATLVAVHFGFLVLSLAAIALYAIVALLSAPQGAALSRPPLE
ncbi:MAG: hypothetical protein ABR589_02895 [Chthoniobacterales bacterium]